MDIGKANAVALNSDKLKTDQKVRIKSDNYPDKEFGVIEGNLHYHKELLNILQIS